MKYTEVAITSTSCTEQQIENMAELLDRLFSLWIPSSQSSALPREEILCEILAHLS